MEYNNSTSKKLLAKIDAALYRRRSDNNSFKRVGNFKVDSICLMCDSVTIGLTFLKRT